MIHGADWLTFLVLVLGCFRVTRIVTTDDWPPSQAFRDWLERRFGEDSSWATLFSCPWCLGWWVSLAGTFAFDRFVVDFSSHDEVVLAVGVAVSAAVGLLGTYDER